jgi:hypothetical protein
MKRAGIGALWTRVTVLTCVVAAGLLPALAAHADWFDDIRLTYDPAASMMSTNNAKCVAADSGGDIHVVWTDYRGGQAAVYHKLFDGSAWSADERLSDSAAVATNPAVAADGLGNVHVVWVDYRDGNAEIYYKKFDGSAWSVDWRLTNDPSNSLYPSVAGDAWGYVHVVWQDLRDYDWEIYYKSFDGGSWGPDTRLTSNSGLSEYPSVTVDTGGDIHVVWQDFRDGDYEIYYKTYDGTWSSDQRLTDVWGASERPCIAPDGLGGLHVAWQDYRGGSYGIYYMKHDGIAWQAEELLTSVSMGQQRPSVAADDSGKVHVVWFAYPEDYSDLYYIAHDGISWGPELRLTYAEYSTENPSASMDPEGNLDVVWHDRRDGNLEIYWKRLTGEILPKPEVTSVEPNSALWNSIAYISNLAGADFLAPAKVWLQRTGEANLDATNVSVVSSTQITCDIDLGPAPSGYWDLVVQNPDNQADTLVAGFQIVPLPVPEVTSIDPDSGYWHSTVHITDLAGNNFTANTLVWLQKDDEPKLYGHNVTIVSPTQIACDIDLITLVAGGWDVVVQIADGQRDTLVAGFNVLPLRKPEVTSIEPNLWPRDQEVHITNLAGHYFSSNAEVYLQKAGEISIYAENVVVESYEKITCDIPLAAAPLGWWDVVVENHDTQTDTLRYGFFIDQSMWGDETRLTSADRTSSTSRPNARCIATDASDDAHLVWFDNRTGGTYGVYYKKYDGTWSAGQLIVSADYDARYPAIAVDGYDKVHVVWEDRRHGAPELYHKYYDGAWSADERLTAAPDYSAWPSLAAHGDNLHAVWEDHRIGNWEIYYKHFDGTVWGADTCLTSGDGSNILPSVAVDGSGRVHVVWCNNSDKDLLYKMFGGVTWSSTVVLDHGNFEGAPSLTVDPYGKIHVAWHGLDSEIYYKQHDGVSWQPKVRLTYDGALSHNTSVVADAHGYVCVLFIDQREGNNELYCARHDGFDWQPEVRLTNAPDDALHPSAAVDSQGRVHVVWRDNRFGNFEIFYRMRFPVGLASIDDSPTVKPRTLALGFSPNPVSASGQIRFSLPRRAPSVLALYDIAGRLVWSDDIGMAEPGLHHVVWDGTDQGGRPVAQGIYFLSLRVGEERLSTKVLVIR